jgi:hypothetical protein
MKKKLKKLLALALSLITLTSVFTACTDKPSTPNVPVDISTNGIHNYKVSETNLDMVKNGSSDYKIVIPKDASDILIFAANELQVLFGEATGVTLPIVKDSSITYSIDAKVISLGETALFKAANLKAEKQTLDRNGFMIKTVGENIFISGAYDDGTNFGVYGYLEQEFDFDCLSNTCYYIEQGIDNLKLKNFDVVDVPDLKVRNNGNSFITNSKTTTRRMRYTDREDGSTFVGSPSAHTVFTYLPPAIYNNANENETYHPDWYSSDGMQLCYTAHGNPEERALMLNEAFEKMKAEFIANTIGYYFIFSQEDKFTWCNCETCLASKRTYNGSDAAVALKFCNDLADKMYDWMQTDEGKPYARDFKVLFLAYGPSLVPPSIYNEKAKQYEAIDTETICGEHTAVLFAPAQMDHQKSLYDEANETYYRAFKGWEPISKTFTIYTYQTNFHYFLCPYDTFEMMSDFYQYAAKVNACWLFDLGQRGQSGAATGWTILKNYLSSKIAWNVNVDVGALTDKFFKIYYGDGAEIMRKWHDSWRIHSNYMVYHGGMAGSDSMYLGLLNKDFWPARVLEVWLERADSAIEAIEAVKYTNLEMYNEWYMHIVTERVSIEYMLIMLYAEDYDENYINTLKCQMKEDCELAGIDVLAESLDNQITNLWSEWGII